MKPRLVYAVLVLIIAMCAGTVSCATEIVLEAPPMVYYEVDGSTLEIPVALSGSDAVLQLVVVKALDQHIPPWVGNAVLAPEDRFDQGLDPLVYVGPQVQCQEGTNNVIWHGRDMDGTVVPFNAYRYYVLAFMPGTVPESPDYGTEHRSDIHSHAAAIVSGIMVGNGFYPRYSVAHFTDTVVTSTRSIVYVESSMINALADGDEIGVYSPRGDLVGAFLKYDDFRATRQFFVYGDEPATPEIEGMLPGEPMTFVIWDYHADTELSAAATFASADTLYTSRTSYTLESLRVIYKTAVSDVPPAPFTLSQNSPNPFNPVTAISFSLAEPSDISLIVYNATGAKVAVLVEGAYPAGRHTAHWDASDHASGMYFYRLSAGGTALTGKMLLVK